MRIMRYFPPLMLAAVVLVFDPAAYGTFHAPKYFVFLILISIGFFTYVSCSVWLNRDKLVSLTLIELLLVLRLFWLAVSHQPLLPSGSDLGMLLLAGLTFTTLLARQIHLWLKTSVSPGSGTDNQSVLNILIRCIWILALGQAVLGLIQWFAFVDSVEHVYKTVLIGTIGPPNGYGIFLAVGVIAGIADNRYSQNSAIRWVTGFSVCLIMIALLLNGSRGALAGLICAGCLTGIMYFRNYKRPVLIAVIVVMVLIFSGLTLYLINPVSADGRYMIWAISWPMFTDYPFAGVGHGRFGYYYLDYQSSFLSNPENLHWSGRAAALHQPHNEYLNAFIEGGVVNGLLFLMILSYSMIRIIRETLNSKNSRTRILYFGLTGILAAVLTHAFVDDPFHVLPVAVLLYLMLGFIPEKVRFTVTIRSSWGKSMIIFPALLCVIGISAKAIDEYPGYRHWQSGLHYAEQHRWNDAVTWYNRAYNVLPDKSELEFHMGAARAMSGNYKEGITLMSKALNRFRDRNLYLSLSHAYMQEGEIDQALTYAEKAHAAFPDQLTPHLLLGELYFLAGDIERSKQSLLKCIHRETRVQSERTFEISGVAMQKWEEFFGRI